MLFAGPKQNYGNNRATQSKSSGEHRISHHDGTIHAGATGANRVFAGTNLVPLRACVTSILVLFSRARASDRHRRQMRAESNNPTFDKPWKED
jgi:hypothetical protein